MRDKILIVLAILTFGVISAQDAKSINAKYKILYLLTYQQDSTDIASLREEPMELFIGNGSSLFQSQYVSYNDSLVKAVSNKYDDDPQRAVNLTLSLRKKTKISYIIYKTPEETLVLDKIFTDKFTYEDNEKMKWKLSNETKHIGNYLCQRATTTYGGRDYTAWYTSEVPISDGPYKFKGLPGLILEIQDSRKQYVFEFLTLEKSDDKFTFDRNNIPETTKEEFYKGLNNFKRDIINQMDQRGFTFDEDNATKVKESVRRTRNNEMEIVY
ncbi:GLPGLI family protein [Aequorivita marina]|uniref:GLPGLI family protein n=1 Tax=Aequorivita marina TaxID=3073654 RepID=UPI002874C6BF|nr:GLPGLI family protein [Aequorivita sp. S2608]MDS1296797.1 GLPGLI family protein [Aequorivita sp. S2608]